MFELRSSHQQRLGKLMRIPGLWRKKSYGDKDLIGRKNQSKPHEKFFIHTEKKAVGIFLFFWKLYLTDEIFF